MPQSLEEEIGELLRKHKLTLATAESATGGLIASLIVNVSGSSDYFKGAVVAYANEVKEKVLGVSKETLEKYGAVSRQTGREMAEGVRRLMEVDIGLSDTGIAGPTGATPGKPVGLFYIGLAFREKTEVGEHLLQGDRLENRRKAAEIALTMLRDYLLSLA